MAERFSSATRALMYSGRWREGSALDGAPGGGGTIASARERDGLDFHLLVPARTERELSAPGAVDAVLDDVAGLVGQLVLQDHLAAVAGVRDDHVALLVARVADAHERPLEVGAEVLVHRDPTTIGTRSGLRSGEWRVRRGRSRDRSTRDCRGGDQERGAGAAEVHNCSLRTWLTRCETIL